MTSFRKLVSPAGSILLMLLAVGVAMVLPAAPAHAQVLDTLTNWITGNNPQEIRALYDQNVQTLNSMSCWGCSIFDAFSTSVFSAGRSVSSSSAGPLASVIVSVSSLFSLVYIGSAFVSGDASDLLNRWKVFWRLMIAVALGCAWINSGGGSFDNTWNVVYSPLMKIPLAVSQAVPGGTDTSGCGGASVSGAPAGAGQVISEMRNVICGGHKITLKGIAFGLALAGSGDGLVGTLCNIVAGLAICAIFVWVAISFPLRFIDVLIRLTVLGIVTPVLVVCAVFKPTRGYCQIGVSNALYAGCMFAFTSIMFKLGSSFFEQAVNDRINMMAQSDSLQQVSQSLVLVASGVIFASMLKMAPALASEFSQFRGQSGGVGDAASSMAATVTTAPVKGAAALGSGAMGVGTQMMAGSMAGKSAAKSLGKGMTKEE